MNVNDLPTAGFMAVRQYVIPIEDYPEIQMPLAAELLHVGEQNGDLTVWARVNPSLPIVTRRFCVTGHVDLGVHVGTVQVRDTLRSLGHNYSGKELVFHVFDLGEPDNPHRRTP